MTIDNNMTILYFIRVIIVNMHGMPLINKRRTNGKMTDINDERTQILHRYKFLRGRVFISTLLMFLSITR